MDELQELERWRAAGYGVLVTGVGADHTGFSWVCSVIASASDTATGANDTPILAIRAALVQANVRWPRVVQP
jgi:hypothetical protein